MIVVRDGVFFMVRSLFIGILLPWFADEHPVAKTIFASEPRAPPTNPGTMLTWRTAPVIASVALLLWRNMAPAGFMIFNLPPDQGIHPASGPLGPPIISRRPPAPSPQILIRLTTSRIRPGRMQAVV